VRAVTAEGVAEAAVQRVRELARLENTDAARETRFPVLPVTPVISYCGA